MNSLSQDKNLTIFDIEWSGPFTIPYDEETWERNLSNVAERVQVGETVYQIYGQHPVFGANALLYIGITERQDARFKEHFKENARFWYFEGVSVHIGVPEPETQNQENALENAEALLIAHHKPPLNRNHIDTPPLEAHSLHIFNWGARGVLFPECSGRWFYWDK